MQRLRLFGERVDLGLGSADRHNADYVSLAQARKTALENRRIVRDGMDPRRQRTPSFAQAQRAAYAELLPQWKEASRFAEKRVSSMERYVLPKIGAVATVQRTVPVTRLAFRFMVLTVARGMEVRRMEWRDVDLDTATWNRPADKMKAGKAHRVPFSRQALDILEAARGFGGDTGPVFPAQGRRGQMLPDNAIRRLVSRVCDGATAHGLRSSFRDRAGETGVEREVAELCLAHVVGDSNERAYARSDLLERRRPVIQR